MKKQLLIATLTATVLAGCATSSPVGLVDVNRIVTNWPLYQQYQQQLLIDQQTIAQSKSSTASKAAQEQALEKKYSGITQQLTEQIRSAATKVAGTKSLKLIVTKEGVGYGGVDITADVEKLMNITEKATPSPK